MTRFNKKIIVMFFMMLIALNFNLHANNQEMIIEKGEMKDIGNKKKVKRTKDDIIDEYNAIKEYKNYSYILFKDENNDIYYIRSDGKVLSNVWLVFSAKSVMANFTIPDASTHYMYFGNDGKAIRNKSKRIGVMYTFDNDGFLISAPPGGIVKNIIFDKDLFVKDLKVAKVGDMVYFGEYNPGFKDLYGGEMMWEVIDKIGDKVLLNSAYIINADSYDDKDNIWETSKIRKWLNESFYDELLKNDSEKNMVLDTNIVTDGIVTTDKIFVLSSEEIVKYYGIYINELTENKKLATMATNYARSKNLYVSDFDYWIKYNSPFFLRDKGYFNNTIKIIRDNGSIDFFGVEVNKDNIFGIRPAMWVNIAN